MEMLKNFRTYQSAVELYRGCEQLEARSHLRDQLLRASLSVVLNLSEGSARSTEKDRKRLYGIALASLRETQTILMLTEREDLFKIADQVGGGLFRLIHPKK